MRFPDGPLLATLAAAFIVCGACGDDGGAGDGTGTESTSSTGGGPDTTMTVTMSSLDTFATSDADGESTATPDSSGTPVDTTGPVPQLEVEVEVFTYPNQPMVVDVVLRSDETLAATLTHADDPGVIIETFAGPDDDAWFRLRGLLPDSDHSVAWTASAEGFTDVEGTTDFTTEAPLPGFIPSFTIEGDGPSFGGYVMFDLLQFPGPGPSGLFVVDPEGRTRWYLGIEDEVTGPPVVFAAAQLRADGSVLYLRDDTLFIRDELGVDQLSITDESLGIVGLHHDVVELDDGNFLALAFTFQDITYPDLGTVHVAGDLIVELTPDGDIVWEWDSFDHLDPQRRREGFETLIYDPVAMENGYDWTHGNAIVYEPATDSILFSMRHQDWIIRIDRATGDVLWRFGEEGDFALDEGTWPYHQHSPQWQADGTLLLYDNGVGNPALPPNQEFSRAVRYAIDEGTMSATQAWEDEAEDFTAVFAGDADRLPNDKILVTDSSIGLLTGMLHARIREIDEASSATPVWSITTEIGTFIYRSTAWDRLPGQLPR